MVEHSSNPSTWEDKAVYEFQDNLGYVVRACPHKQTHPRIYDALALEILA